MANYRVIVDGHDTSLRSPTFGGVRLWRRSMEKSLKSSWSHKEQQVCLSLFLPLRRSARVRRLSRSTSRVHAG